MRFVDVSGAVNSVSWNVPRAVVAAVLTAVVVGVPTDVIDTSFFMRMTPVRWWEPAVVVAMAVLMFAWAGIEAAPRGRPSNVRSVFGVVGSALAVGCPVCNKIAVSLLGVSGALSVWAPVQPILAGVSVLASAGAVLARWRGARCVGDECRRAESDTDVEAKPLGILAEKSPGLPGRGEREVSRPCEV